MEQCKLLIQYDYILTKRMPYEERSTQGKYHTNMKAEKCARGCVGLELGEMVVTKPSAHEVTGDATATEEEAAYLQDQYDTGQFFTEPKVSK
ncbi:TPA: hypothetical protein BOS_8441 [Bos taurus]|nr:TPA: hypothetical protein BOS_8441 [Bos taurus]